jgi:hypothetical protein
MCPKIGWKIYFLRIILKYGKRQNFCKNFLKFGINITDDMEESYNGGLNG